MSQGQIVNVQLMIPDRGPGLPPSIPLNRDTLVRVQINPSLAGTQDSIAFTITGGSAQSGDAVVVGGEQLKASGNLTIRGTAQTQPGYARDLRLVATLNGKQQATSGGFSVCAHPCAVENGPHHVPYQINPESLEKGVVGMEVQIVIVSDSGAIADLNEVTEREIVSDTHSRSASMNDFPKWNVQVQRVLQPVANVDLDWHTVNVCSLRAMLLAHLQGSQGEWSQDQFDEFRCARCGMNAAVVIKNSGYRITRIVEFDTANVLWLTVKKFSWQCTIAERTASAGPTPSLEVKMRVPPGNVATGFQFP
ncbi:hypothetical protein Pan153_47000 [Gimesia panareensis]|uniref:Uncharacterized protein n=1 Tax=Gimesia panareensis TaxID=2527978 RepID=A0A518FUK9_9PLAN|nr:hypothetical protein [Gimesia panareensis]QDV20031.1 hypothetical protein Pan153_47000 [Gimesia panareensis]